MEGGIFPPWLMLLVTIAAFIGAAYYAKRHEDYMVAAWMMPLFWLLLFYAILTFQIDPIHGDVEIRESLEWTGEFFLLLFMCLRFLNGNVNRLIARIHPKWTQFQARVVRRIERSAHWQLWVFRLRIVRNRLNQYRAKGAEWIKRFKL